MIKQWFKSLDKREQLMVMVAASALLIYIVFGLLYRGLDKAHDKAERQFQQQSKDVEWVRNTVQTLQAMKSSSPAGDAGDRSLAQLAEEAAKFADVRVARFQPKDDSEAQVWLEREDFNKVAVFLNQLEQVFGLTLEDVAITSANSPGLVNLRLKLSK
jgi:type II secretory pathway component PulM